MTKEKLTRLFTALSLIMALLLVAKSYFKEQQIKKSLPLLTNGEQINYFNLIDVDENKITKKNLLKGPALIYIFRQPCSTCNSNFKFWNRMSIILNNYNIPSYGIVLGNESELFSLAESREIHFTLCTPDNQKHFIDTFRVRINLSQTLLLNKGKVTRISLGPLDSNSYKTFITKAKELKQGQTS